MGCGADRVPCPQVPVTRRLRTRVFAARGRIYTHARARVGHARVRQCMSARVIDAGFTAPTAAAAAAAASATATATPAGATARIVWLGASSPTGPALVAGLVLLAILLVVALRAIVRRINTEVCRLQVHQSEAEGCDTGACDCDEYNGGGGGNGDYDDDEPRAAVRRR